MPFGLRNAGSSFQRMMDRVVSGLPFAYVYLDDLRVASVDRSTHLMHLQTILERLRDFGLVISLEKCAFLVDSFEFLGHQVTAGGARPLTSYVEAVRARQPPSTVKELQIFLGLLNFYRRFLPGAARMLLPLTDALKGGPAPAAKIDWSPAMELAFQAAKKSLVDATWLAHPHPRALLALHVDASATHVGAALHQQEPGSDAWRPLGFFSKKLDAAQVKWSAFDRELLACVVSIRHFRYILEGRAFAILTDHKPLLGALNRTTDPWTARQCRHLAYVAEFTSDVRHVAGADNVVADALSRPPEHVLAAVDPSDSPLPDLHGMAARQSTCEDVQAARSLPSLNVQFRDVDGVQILCDVSGGRWRPLVPSADRHVVFNAVHGVAHPGIRATRRLVAARYLWPGMRSDIAAWCRDCVGCNRAKAGRQHTAEVQPIAIPRRRFSHVHVDIVGPLPVAADGSSYLLTAVDRTTRWLEAVPLKNMSAATCTDAFLSTWVARYGVPDTVTTDRGTQFTSETWQLLCKKLGTKHVLTTAYHPQANGVVERAHRQLKDALRAREAGVEWPQHLPWVLLGLRAAPKEVSGLSSAEAVFGQQLTLPGTLLHVPDAHPADLKRRLASEDPPPTVQPRTWAEVAAKNVQPALQQAELVYVRRGGMAHALAPKYVGPYRVLERGLKTFTILVGEREEVVTVDRLKPHLGTRPLQPAVPPTRGRPRIFKPP
jgi:transposase InsO family protein